LKQGQISADEMIKLTTKIDRLDQELLKSLDEFLSTQGVAVKDDVIAEALVDALARAYAIAPDVNVVLVLNSCTSSNIYNKMVKIARRKIDPKNTGQCCVLHTKLQWPGSILPRFLQTMLVAAKGGRGNMDQLAMQSELAETLKKNVDSYTEIECEGQSEDHINAMEYAHAMAFGRI